MHYTFTVGGCRNSRTLEAITSSMYIEPNYKSSFHMNGVCKYNPLCWWPLYNCNDSFSKNNCVKWCCFQKCVKATQCICDLQNVSTYCIDYFCSTNRIITWLMFVVSKIQHSILFFLSCIIFIFIITIVNWERFCHLQCLVHVNNSHRVKNKSVYKA